MQQNGICPREPRSRRHKDSGGKRALPVGRQEESCPFKRLPHPFPQGAGGEPLSREDGDAEDAPEGALIHPPAPPHKRPLLGEHQKGAPARSERRKQLQAAGEAPRTP